MFQIYIIYRYSSDKNLNLHAKFLKFNFRNLYEFNILLYVFLRFVLLYAIYSEMPILKKKQLYVSPVHDL